MIVSTGAEGGANVSSNIGSVSDGGSPPQKKEEKKGDWLHREQIIDNLFLFLAHISSPVASKPRERWKSGASQLCKLGSLI